MTPIVPHLDKLAVCFSAFIEALLYMLNITQAVGQNKVQPPFQNWCQVSSPPVCLEAEGKGSKRAKAVIKTCCSPPPRAMVYCLQFIDGPVRGARVQAVFTPEWSQDVHRLILAGF